jgi:hypothetical protein
MFGKVAEVVIACDQWHIVVDARLSDEGVGNSRPKPKLLQGAANFTGSFPKANQYWKHFQLFDLGLKNSSRAGVAEDLRNDNGWQRQINTRKSSGEPLNVGTFKALKISDECAGISRNHSRS